MFAVSTFSSLIFPTTMLLSPTQSAFLSMVTKDLFPNGQIFYFWASFPTTSLQLLTMLAISSLGACLTTFFSFPSYSSDFGGEGGGPLSWSENDYVLIFPYLITISCP